jgi:anaphase-promoting complex subunit 6
MERFLREWRQDALNKAQYDSAIFIGDKLLALTSMLCWTWTSCLRDPAIATPLTI